MNTINTIEEYKNGLKENNKVIVKLSSLACGPCRLLQTVLSSLAEQEINGYVCLLVDVDDSPEITEELGIRALPTLVKFKNGVEVDRTVGASNKKDLVKWLSL